MRTTIPARPKQVNETGVKILDGVLMHICALEAVLLVGMGAALRTLFNQAALIRQDSGQADARGDARVLRLVRV